MGVDGGGDEGEGVVGLNGRRFEGVIASIGRKRCIVM